MNKDTITAILQNHALYLADPTTGKCADLSGADLSGAAIKVGNVTRTLD